VVPHRSETAGDGAIRLHQQGNAEAGSGAVCRRRTIDTDGDIRLTLGRHDVACFTTALRNEGHVQSGVSMHGRPVRPSRRLKPDVPDDGAKLLRQPLAATEIRNAAEHDRAVWPSDNVQARPG
jgi:hypothetical protein